MQDKENDHKRSCNDNGQDETIDLVSSGSDSEESNMDVLSKRPAKKMAIKHHEISQFFVGSAPTANLSHKFSVVTKNSHKKKKSPPAPKNCRPSADSLKCIDPPHANQRHLLFLNQTETVDASNSIGS